MRPSISVVIPAYNAASTLPRCLQAIRQSNVAPVECIVVIDGSSDDSALIAAKFEAVVCHTTGRHGPAHARNLGARNAKGDVSMFVDADVCVHRDTLEKIASRFANDTTLDGIVGSYDDRPPEPDFFSQYRNLMHHYVHQRAAGPVATFWTGCGAIRTEVFAAMQGLDERYRTPSIEDIDLGYRMAAAGYRIELDPSVQVTHLKRWTLPDIVLTDVFRRGIPWVRLMLRQRRAPNHLNVSQSQRASVALAWIGVVLAVAGSVLAIIPLGVVVALNLDFYRFLRRRRGLWFAVLAGPMHLLYYLYNGVSLAAGTLAHAWTSLSRPRSHAR